jgi:hypothetical protein
VDEFARAVHSARNVAAQRGSNRLGTCMDAELQEDVLEVLADRTRRDYEALGDRRFV